MKRIKLTTGEYLLVEVPVWSSQHCFEAGGCDVIRYYPRHYNNIHDTRRIELPRGQWEIIGRASELPTIGSGDLLIAVVENDMNPETTLIIRKI